MIPYSHDRDFASRLTSMTTTTTPSTNEKAKSFGAYASTYDKFRPAYPQAAIHAILDATKHATNVDTTEQLVVVDLAAGTGKAAMQYAHHVSRVICVDHDARMLDQCLLVAKEQQLEDVVHVVHGYAEETRLEKASAHLVAAHQAFHWFDVRSTMKELHRVITPNGIAAAVWNRKDLSNACSREIEHAIREYNPSYEKTFFSSPMARVLHSDTSENVDLDWSQLLQNGAMDLFSMQSRMQFPFALTYSGDDEVISLLETFSYVRSIDATKKSALFEKVRAIVENHAESDGSVILGYVTHIYLMKKCDT